MKRVKSSGQSMVEYLLLMGVVITLVLTVLNSEAFKKLLGADSSVFDGFRKRIQYTYRHGVNGINENVNYGGGQHDTYYNGKTRFFVPGAEYPQ